MAELKDQCAATKAAAIDLERRRAEIRRQRFLRTWTDQDGKWHLIAAGIPEDGAQIMAALIPRANQIFEAARLRGERENPGAYRFDALVQLATDDTSDPDLQPSQPEGKRRDGGASERTEVESENSVDLSAEGMEECGSAPEPATTDPPVPSPAAAPVATASNHRGPRKARLRTRRGAPVKLLLRVHLEAFLRGFPVEGETCDLVGYGPLSMSAVHEILAHGDPFVAAILTKGKQLMGVAHLGRRPNAYQRSCLEWLYPTCAVQGCPAAARLEMDHRDDWARTHVTVLDLLDALCPHHHRLKTREGWSLVDGFGKRAFVAPGDPRHPRNGDPAGTDEDPSGRTDTVTAAEYRVRQ